MNKAIIDRGASFKKVKISYTTQIPDEYLVKYCMKYMVSRNEAVKLLKEAAINAAEQEIDNQLTIEEVRNVHEIYDNRE